MQNLLDVPQSIYVINGKFIDEAGINSINDVMLHVPSLYISELTARRTSFPSIRGLSSGQGEPVVTTFIDGVPQLTQNTINIEFMDIERIEVLRGPQGTLYGKNTLAGAINIVTTKPTEEPQAQSEISYGNFSRQRYALSLQGPLGPENLRYSIGGIYFERDGFTQNTFTGSEVDDRETIFGQSQFVYTPNDQLELVLKVYGERDRDGGFVLFDVGQIRENPYRISKDFDGFTNRDIIAPSLTLIYFGDSVEMKSISAYEHWSAEEETDVDFTNNDFLRRTTEEYQNQFYQEFRIQPSVDQSVHLSDFLSFNWLAGISMFYSDFNHDSLTDSRPIFIAINQAQSGGFPVPDDDFAEYELKDFGFAAFGQTTFTWRDKLDMIVGLRYDYEKKDTDLELLTITAPLSEVRAAVKFDDSFQELLPKFGLNYHWSDQFITYTSAAKGYRPGGYNRNVAQGGTYTFEEEESWTYEAGLKSELFNRRLSLHLALFYISWDDMQLDIPNPAVPQRFFLDNVGEATSKGIEFDFRTEVNQNWSFTGGLGYVNAEFDDYIDPITQTQVDGKDLPNVPDLTWNLGVHHQIECTNQLTLVSRLDLLGVGEIHFDNTNSESQIDYILTNVRIGLKNNTWGIDFWVNNVFDKEYVSTAFQDLFFSPSGFAGRNGAPRTYGITLRVKI